MDNIPIFIINLKQDAQKKKQMQIQLDKLGLKAEFVEAVDGRKLGEDEKNKVYDHQKTIRAIGRELTNGEIGCALSHQKIYKKLVEQKIPYAVILEDDAILCNDFKTIVENIIRKTQQFDIVLLGHNANIKQYILPYTFWGYKKIIGKYFLFRPTTWCYGTYGYIISCLGAEKLMQNSKIFLPADHYTGNIGKLDIFILLPRCIGVSQLEDSSLRLERKQILKEERNTFWQKIRRITGIVVFRFVPFSIVSRLHNIRDSKQGKWNDES